VNALAEVDHPRPYRHVGAEDLDQFVILYAKGKSIRSIAQQLGFSYGAVYRWLKDSGVQLRRRGGQ